MRFTAVMAALFLAAPVVAEEGLKSGCPTGSSVPAFQVLDVTGKAAGSKLCYI